MGETAAAQRENALIEEEPERRGDATSAALDVFAELVASTGKARPSRRTFNDAES
jgi:hypothetical protein